NTVPLLERARTHTQSTMDGIFEAIKDAVLDAAGDDDFEDEQDSATPLPPLRPEDLAAAMLPSVEDALREVADTINAAPNVRSAGLCQECLSALIANLVGAALEVGFRLRIEAAEAAAPLPRPQGEWAQKYRQMVAADGRWPPLG